MTREVDVLTALTLEEPARALVGRRLHCIPQRHAATESGRRILDLGCGAGIAEVQLSRLRLTQIQLVAVDLLVSRVAQARAAAQSHNIRAQFSAADARALAVYRQAPLTRRSASPFCSTSATSRKPCASWSASPGSGGRIVAVEPDNADAIALLVPSTSACARTSPRVALCEPYAGRGDTTDASVGPTLPTLFAQNGIEPLSVHLFPVSRAQLGAPSKTCVGGRAAERLQAEIDRAPGESIRRMGQDYMKPARPLRHGSLGGRVGVRRDPEHDALSQPSASARRWSQTKKG